LFKALGRTDNAKQLLQADAASQRCSILALYVRFWPKADIGEAGD